MGKRDNFTVEALSQQQADELIKDLKKKGGAVFKGFLISFEDEQKRLLESMEAKDRPGDDMWALPPDERTYYIVKYGKRPYLLIGMSHYDTISSLAKITSALHGKGADSLRILIEKELVNKCYAGVIYMQLGDACDPRIRSLLLDLKHNLPEGIEKIYVFHDAASIICKAKTSAIWDEKTA
jgi:hypothetical protein